jgi:hypothetical protein
MNKKSLRMSVAAAVGGAVLLAGLLVGVSFALAQDTDDSRAIEQSTDEGEFHHRDGFDLFGDLDVDLGELREQLESGASLDEALDGLGLDLEELAGQALEDALAHLDEMVADGRMTQEHADSLEEMLEGLDFSDGLPFGIGGFRFDGEFPKFPIDGMRGPGGHGHGFFGDRDCGPTSIGEETLVDA